MKQYRTTVVSLAVAMIAGIVRADSEPFTDWAAFDAWVEASRDCSRFAGALYPPGMSRVGDSLGILMFDPNELPELDALPEETLLGAHGHRIFLWDDGTTPVQWTIRDSTGAVVRVLFPTNAFDPDDWVESEYGTPPSWLSGEAIDNWYSDRHPSRIVPSALLMSTNEWTAYHTALLAAAATNVPVDHSTPVRPSTTNALAFAAFTMGPNGVPSGWLFSPWPTRPHAVFRKETLDQPLWEPAIELVPDGEFAAWSDVEAVEGEPPLRSLPGGAGATGFFSAAEVATDSDGDGIPDGMEILAHGSSPWLADTDGDGLSDYDEVHRYGTNPASGDTNGDGIPDNVALNGLLDPNGDDYDGDGLTDAEERFVYMTDPRDADTDGDGLSDYDEVIVHGTSPFATDTEGDGLSDQREIVELGSNPLSWDTDGDGIDDYKEYNSRDHGLDILDASDAWDDYDGDSFSDASEYAWGWSHISRAVTNGTPQTRLLRIHVGEAPRYKSSNDYGMIALGRDAAKGARIRIPKSVQVGTNTMGRTLHWTAAPGIHIGDTELSSAGSRSIPDENVELDIWTTPGHGGANTGLVLVNANGTTNASINIRVPKMSRAPIYLSNFSNNSSATNLVPGTIGVFCTGADAPLFEKPRLTVHPELSSDTFTGHRGLTNTDYVLARVSGATPEETKTLNYLRWDSAWGTSGTHRRGFDLEPGLTRLDVGIDIDFDGELDSDEIEISCDVYVVPVRLSVDTNRDGTIDEDDREGRSQWTPQHGALVAIDSSQESADPYRAALDSPLMKLKVESTGIPLPDDYYFSLTPSYSSSARIHAEGGVSRSILVYGSATNGFENIDEDDARFFVSWNDANGTNYPTGTYQITLSLRKPNKTIIQDVVRFKIPPIIIPWSTLPLRRLFTSKKDGSWCFPSNILANVQFSITNANACWVQDMMQAATFRIDELRGWTPLALDLGHSQENNAIDKLPTAIGTTFGETLCRYAINNSGNGGNVEATPPLPGYPFGRLLTLVDRYGTTCSAIKTLEKQGVQGPSIRLPGGWLSVGHVDEVCCFVGERTVLVPSPRLAFDLIASDVIRHGGVDTNEFVWGTTRDDYPWRMQRIAFSTVVTNANWCVVPHAGGMTVTGQEYGFSEGDFILFLNAVYCVTSSVSENGQCSLELEECIPEVAVEEIMEPSLVCRLSYNSIENIVPDLGESVSEKIDLIVDELSRNIPDLSVVPVPVLFERSASSFVAGTPNLVNCIVDGNNVYMPDPGCALFRDAVDLPGKHFVGGDDYWNDYHCLMGELHCGSEAERIIPPELIWWNSEVFLEWPFRGSGQP